MEERAKRHRQGSEDVNMQMPERFWEIPFISNSKLTPAEKNNLKARAPTNVRENPRVLTVKIVQDEMKYMYGKDHEMNSAKKIENEGRHFVAEEHGLSMSQYMRTQKIVRSP